MIVASVVTVSVAVAASSWQKDDPSQWTSEDVYQILNNSPWSKSATVNIARGGYGSEGSGGGPWDEGTPGGGMGRGGMGRGGGGLGGGGLGRRGGGYPSAGQGPTITVRWASALPVRLAEAKSAGGSADAAALKPLNEYVIAVLGLPKSAFESQGSTSGSDADPDADAKLADHLMVITVWPLAMSG